MRIFITVFFFFLCFGCQNRERPVDKETLLSIDYRLFQKTKVWELAKAVQDEDTAMVRQLVTDHSLNIDFREPIYGNTLLMLAVYNGDYKSAKALLDLGANPNLKNRRNGEAAIHFAAENDNPVGLKLLFNYKGDPNIVSGNEGDTILRQTPLNVAITYSGKDFQNVKTLVDAGADFNYGWRDSVYGPYPPLSEAITPLKLKVALYLLEKGADYKEVMFRTAQGETIYILGALRRFIIDINTEEYKYKRKVITFLKARGLDYDKEPIPQFIEDSIKKRYPDNWKEYLEKY